MSEIRTFLSVDGSFLSLRISVRAFCFDADILFWKRNSMLIETQFILTMFSSRIISISLYLVECVRPLLESTVTSLY